MNPKFKNLLVRTASGIVYVALMVAGTFYPPLMCVLMAVVSSLAIREFYNLTSGPVDRSARELTIEVAIISQLLIALSMIPNFFSMCGFAEDKKLICLIIGYFPLIILYGIVMSIKELKHSHPAPIEHISKNFWGLFWIVVPLTLLSLFSITAPEVVLAFLIIIWANDSFAYLGGSLFGKHKMCPRISPNKTWEGAIIGCLMSLVLVWFLLQIDYFRMSIPEVWKGMLLALVTVVFGTFGDLLESHFKRYAGVKDSGNAIPGHGGILDRFDSILFAFPPVVIYALLAL